MVATFVATVFLGAALLFLIQPMFARMVLPLLGGSPSVWNTAMVFFQAVLLAGYAYVHLSTTRLGVRRQAMVHLWLLALPLLLLPIRLPPGWAPPAQQSPVLWLLALLAVSVGLPFFVVSTTGPLLQKWFASTRARTAGDPYFLYSASNLGSMLGLLSYPFLLETSLRLADQSRLWTLGYGLLVVLAAACSTALWRADGRQPGNAAITNDPGPSPAGPASDPPLAQSVPSPSTTSPDRITAYRRVRWVLLALAPSSLMLGVTTHLTSDIAAIPLLWVVPLAIYLLTFTLAFARRTWIPRSLVLRALPLVLLPLSVVVVTRIYVVWLMVPLHLLLQLVATLACHRELADDRPSTRHLTEFYLWLAVGGVLGGAFNALIAPLVFTSVTEYPLALVLIALLAPPIRPLEPGRRHRAFDVAVPLGMLLIIAGIVAAARWQGRAVGHPELVLLSAGLAFPLLSFSRRPLRFGLGLAVLLLGLPMLFADRGREVHAERSFFGVHRVLRDPAHHLQRLMHGTTVHGIQSLDPARRGEPLGYYHRNGPAGDVFASLRARRPGARVAVAGLGAGTLAAFGEPGQDWTFYEIDPTVERIARDSRWFTYLRDCRARERVVLGDARLALARATHERYDLLVLDAYSSDAIPVHLITREALRLYLDRLAPDGMLAFHISNRYFDLAPVVGRLAADAGLVCRIRIDHVSRADLDQGATSSRYVVMVRAPEDLGALRADPRWTHLGEDTRVALWTDDFASPLGVLRWGEALPMRTALRATAAAP